MTNLFGSAQEKTIQSAAALTISDTRVFTAGKCACAIIQWDSGNGSAPLTVVDAAGTWTLGDTLPGSTPDGQLNAFYYFNNHPGGSYTVIATWLANASFRNMILFEVTATGVVHKVKVNAGTAFGTATDGVTTGNYVTTLDGCLLACVNWNYVAATAQTAGTSYTDSGGTGVSNFYYEDVVQPTQSSTTKGTWTQGAEGGIFIVGIAFAPAAGATVNPASGTITYIGGQPTVTVASGAALNPSAAHITYTGGSPSVSKTSFTWYSLPAAGGYDTNSIIAGQTYPTGSFIRVVSDFAHITADYATGPLQNDINNYSTPEPGYSGTDSAIYEIKSSTDGSTSQYTVTVTISTSIVIGPLPGTVTYAGGTPNVKTGIVLTPAPALITYAGGTPTVAATANIVLNPATARITYAGGSPTVNGSGQGTASPNPTTISATQRTALIKLLKFLIDRRHRR